MSTYDDSVSVLICCANKTSTGPVSVIDSMLFHIIANFLTKPSFYVVITKHDGNCTYCNRKDLWLQLLLSYDLKYIYKHFENWSEDIVVVKLTENPVIMKFGYAKYYPCELCDGDGLHRFKIDGKAPLLGENDDQVEWSEVVLTSKNINQIVSQKDDYSLSYVLNRNNITVIE